MKLPLIGEYSVDQVRKQGKSAPGGVVLGPTRYEKGPKVRLVIIFKERMFC
jgi:hypothetical protein